jgi:2-keto-4-pentenoate hydratase/2-oxohepta-3-ene-1,7-dioic acid hydratase in catechol pathway
MKSASVISQSANLIALITRGITLDSGDTNSTGTLPRVGSAQNPPCSKTVIA